MSFRSCHSFFLTVCLLLSLALPAWGKDTYTPIQTTPDDLTLLDVGTVTEIIKSDLIKLDNQKIYRLDNIRIPVHYDAHALDYLDENVLNKRVGIFSSRRTVQGRRDRLGNTVVHAVLDDGTWIQADLVKRGLSWAYSTETNRDLAQPLYKLENSARLAKLGFWADPAYAVRDKTTVQGKQNSFQVVEDTVLNIGSNSGRYFLNFDASYKTDFTIEASGDLLNDKFIVDGKLIPPDRWRGLRVRIHGWVENKNGPMIELTHPEQIEIIAPQ